VEGGKENSPSFAWLPSSSSLLCWPISSVAASNACAVVLYSTWPGWAGETKERTTWWTCPGWRPWVNWCVVSTSAKSSTVTTPAFPTSNFWHVSNTSRTHCCTYSARLKGASSWRWPRWDDTRRITAARKTWPRNTWMPSPLESTERVRWWWWEEDDLKWDKFDWF
jgi:hypothetical protein